MNDNKNNLFVEKFLTVYTEAVRINKSSVCSGIIRTDTCGDNSLVKKFIQIPLKR